MRREELLTPGLVRLLQEHARDEYPREAVGLVTSCSYVPLKNISKKPETHTLVPRSAMLPYLDDLVATFHSHPDGPHCPSALDMQSQISMGCVSIIVSVNADGACLPPLAFGDQLEPPPLLGQRGFQHGVTDCYELIRDHRWLTYNERLPQFPRSWDWWRNDQSLYLEGFAKAGYRELTAGERPREGDVWLAQVRSSVPNHAGVLVSDQKMLHHAAGRLPYDPSRLSKREPWIRWQDHITHWVRRDAP